MTTTTLGTVKGSQETTENIYILLDTGCSNTIISKNYLNLCKSIKKSKSRYSTAVGVYKTSKHGTIKFKLPEFSNSKEITWNMDIGDLGVLEYDMIIGRDLMKSLGLIIDFKHEVLRWDDVTIPMNRTKIINKKEFNEIFQLATEPRTVQKATERVTKILDAHYEKANLVDVVKRHCCHLSTKRREAILNLLLQYEDLFDGTLGTFHTKPVHLELKKDAVPKHHKAFPVAKIHEETLKKELDRLCKLGVLKKNSDSTWAAPTFIIPKKNGTVRFISDFRYLNKCLVRKPYPIPKIADVLQKIEGLEWATSLDLNMGYYTVHLDLYSQKLCTIVTPWGKYQYLRLPMGVNVSPDVFQEKMSNLMQDLEYVRTYLDDLLVISNGSFEEHLHQLGKVLQRLRRAGLKINAEKSSFFAPEIEYLGYLLTKDGIKPVQKKIQAVLDLQPPTTLKELRRFLGMVQFYRDMWKQRSHILAPLTDLVGLGKKKIKWEPNHQRSFEEIKKVLAKETILNYPKFDRPFDIHTDASDRQLGAVISQDGKPLAFYSRKLSSAQRNYTTTEQELLSIVETLKEFRNILLGQIIKVHTDHKNLVHESELKTSQRVMRWRLLLEEFGPEIVYIKGPKNVVADALSRLPKQGDIVDDVEAVLPFASKDEEIFPIQLQQIQNSQSKDRSLRKRLKDNPKHYQRKNIENVQVITYKDRIFVPKELRNRTLTWYHHYLCHPGRDRMYKTMAATLYWDNMETDVSKFIKTCSTCQRFKKSKKKYGKLPPKEVTMTPWETVCIDLIGPYTVTDRSGNDRILNAMTFVDPATGWFEITEIPDKTSARISQIFNSTWLARYPRPRKVIFDNGNEFKKDFLPLLRDFSIKPTPTTIKNPQANAILERVHQVLGDMLRTKNLQQYDFDALDPWSDILASVAWAIRSTHHSTLKASPAQLVFNRDMLLNIKFIADWETIRLRKQKDVDRNNERENSLRVDHDYHIGDKVLVTDNDIHRKLNCPTKGPYNIIQVYTNGTVRVQKGAVTERINIRRCTPYTETHQFGGGVP